MAWIEPVNLEWVFSQPWSSRARDVYFWLLHNRTRKPRKFHRAGKLVQMVEGEFITSRREISEHLGMTHTQVRRAIEELVFSGSLVVTRYTKFSVFCVKNYRKAIPEAVTHNLTNTKNPQLVIIKGESDLKKEPVTNTLTDYKKNTERKNTDIADTSSQKPLSIHVKEVFVSLYRQKYGHGYYWGGREAKHAKQLADFLNTETDDFFKALDEITTQFFLDSSEYVESRKHAIWVLTGEPQRWLSAKKESQFPKLVQRTV